VEGRLVRGRLGDGPDAAPEALGRLELRRRLGLLADRGLQAAAARRGFETARREPGGRPPIPAGTEPEIAEIVRRAQPYSLTSPARMVGLCDAVSYVSRAGIEGAIVECGVWRGGSMIATALTLLAEGDDRRDLFMYDTFGEVPPPDEADGADRIRDFPEAVRSGVFELLPLDRVRELLVDTGYPPERLHFVQGLVEETIPERAPERIALCRLDTDWYRSTKHELDHLVPRIAPGGVLLIDDYGEYEGARRAVDEYCTEHDLTLLWYRLDESGRLTLLPG
jgi:O-methyltransferase